MHRNTIDICSLTVLLSESLVILCHHLGMGFICLTLPPRQNRALREKKKDQGEMRWK